MSSPPSGINHGKPAPSDNTKRHRGYSINHDSTFEKRLRRGDERNRNTQPRGYSDDSGGHVYYGPPTTNDHFQDAFRSNEWKCLECSAWNDNGIECKRCRWKAPQLLRRGRYKDDEQYPSRNRGYVHEDSNNTTSTFNSSIRDETNNDQKPNNSHVVDENLNTDFDEFGRIKSIQPKKIRWPPCFDTHGSDYVLDARSGMFYESISDFFYDPKSKFYYGNKQRAYFQYDPVKQSFIKVSDDTEGTSGGTDATVVDGTFEAMVQSAEVKKASITINLKTKSLTSSKGHKKPKKEDGSTKEKHSIAVPEPVVVPKEHAANLEKWTERQKEIRQEEGKVTHEDDTTTRTKISATAKGEPICLLCRRRFPNLDKLRHHEIASNLHKENLAKQAAAAKLTTDSAIDTAASVSIKGDTIGADATVQPSPITTGYIDRAEQRRKLHQPDVSTHNKLHSLDSDLHSIVSTDTNHSTSIKPMSRNTLDESNIGHQMLQKLGWKSGGVLGKSVADSNVNTTAQQLEQSESFAPPAPTKPSSLIEQDWDRIEAVSKRSSQGFKMNKKGIGH